MLGIAVNRRSHAFSPGRMSSKPDIAKLSLNDFETFCSEPTFKRTIDCQTWCSFARTANYITYYMPSLAAAFCTAVAGIQQKSQTTTKQQNARLRISSFGRSDKGFTGSLGISKREPCTKRHFVVRLCCSRTCETNILVPRSAIWDPQSVRYSRNSRWLTALLRLIS